MSARASFALRPPRAAPQRRRGVHRVWITEDPAASALGAPSLWEHQGPLHKGVRASFTLGHPRSS